MATISSIFKMQDQATKTFHTVSNAMDKMIEKADQLSEQSANFDGISNLNPALSQAISTYQSLISQQEMVNEKIDLMSRQEKLLLADLQKQKNAYGDNEAAILKLEQRLFGVRKQKDDLIKKSDQLTGKIMEQAAAVNNVGKKGFTDWQAKIITINQGLQLARSIIGGIQSVMNFADNLTLSSARLGLVNDGLQSTEELQRKIYASAQRSRGSYDDMAKSVSKLGLLAGDAFNNNDEMIAFSEMMQKSFKISGASQQEISSATYQLTQAMAAGKLQGDEFRSITENAPMLADAIAKYMGKSKGELRELSREGKITADIIKAAMFTAADDINAQYENMPRTFADMTTSIKNTAQLEFQKVADKISEMLNNPEIISFMEKVEKGIKVVAKGAEIAVGAIAKVVAFTNKHLGLIVTMLGVVGTYMLISLIPAIMKTTAALWAKATAWMAAHWQLLAILGILVFAYSVFQSTGDILTTLAWTILLVAGAMAIWNMVQWALNGALYACPIVWIIVLILAVIAAIYLLIDWILKLTDSTNSALGIIMGSLFTAAAAIYNIFAALVNTVMDIFVVLWNFIASFANFLANVFIDPIGSIARLFFDLVDTVLGLLETLASVIDTIFGSELSKSVAGWRDDLGSWVDDKFGKENEVMEKMSADDLHLGRWEYADAWDQGLEFGNNVSKAIDEFSMEDALSGIMGSAEDKYGEYDYESLLDANGNVPVDVKNREEVDISDEDLKMLKDIATREYMLNYKHVTPNVNIEFGDVRETADVNKIKDALQRMMAEELSELYVVEEA